VQHCPMADSFKGADWLSKKKEILNPYFGQSMLTCGSITKTIE
jgi:Cu(I)/Ag(I) efflux system membrane fusion protein